jgi:2-dehydropantoate 2-reductase
VKALVVGGGAVGSFLALALASAGIPTDIVRRRGARSETRELTVVGPGSGTSSAMVTVVPSADRIDTEPALVVLAMKAFDLANAVSSLPAFDAATFVSVQNGIGSEEAIMDLRPGNPLIAASLSASVDLESEDRMRWLRRGGIGLSTVRPGDIAPATMASAFDQFGLRARVFPDWRAMKWSKLVANLVGNATSALVDMPPAAVYAERGLFAIERAQLLEAFSVLRALGLAPVALPGADVRRLKVAIGLPEPLARAILRLVVGGGRGGKDPSLRLGLASGASRSEVGWLNGAVVRTGARLGIATPVNAALTELLERALVDPDHRAAFRHRPAALADAVANYRVATDPARTHRATSR